MLSIKTAGSSITYIDADIGSIGSNFAGNSGHGIAVELACIWHEDKGDYSCEHYVKTGSHRSHFPQILRRGSLSPKQHSSGQNTDDIRQQLRRQTKDEEN
jgi:hypothetical protein